MTKRDFLQRASSADSGASAELRALLQTTQRDEPTEELLAALAERLEPLFDAPPDGGGSDGGGGGPVADDLRGGAAAAPNSGASSVLTQSIVIGVLALGVAGAGLWWADSGSVETGRVELRSLTRKPHLGAAPASSPALPSRASASPPAPSALIVKTGADAAAPPSESELMKRAHSALRSGSPHRAMSWLDQHQKHYPGGVLMQEREVVAIESLMMMGRRAEAQRRGEMFLRRFGASTHARRVRAILGTTPDGGAPAPSP